MLQTIAQYGGKEGQFFKHLTTVFMYTGYIASNGRKAVKHELERMRKKLAMDTLM
jgi:hypothetical protein